MFSMVCFPLRKVEELIRPAGHALCRWRVPFCRCGPKFEQSFLKEGFLVFEFQLPGKGRGQLWPSGGAAKLSCQGRFPGTFFFLNSMFYQEIGKAMLKIYLGMIGKT